MSRAHARSTGPVPVVESNARVIPLASGLKTRVFHSISEIPPEVWDSLLDPDDAPATHRFVSACEEAGVAGATFRYLLFERERRLVGWAGLCRMDVSLDLLADPGLRRIIQVGRRAWPRLLKVPILFCGPPVSLGQSWLRVRSQSDAPAVVAAMAEVVEALARELDTSLICFKEFGEDELSVAGQLVGHGYFAAPSLPGCRLDVRWPDLAGYRADLRSGYRRQWDDTLRSAARLGWQIRTVHDVVRAIDQFVPLYDQVMAHATNRLEWLERPFFLRLAEHLGGELRMLELRDDTQTRAMALLLRTPGTLWFLLAGLDYECDPDLRGYPYLVGRVVAEAIESGARCVELGQTSLGVKTRLGGRPTPRWFYLKHVRPRSHWWIEQSAGWLFPAPRAPARRVFHT